jgi:hypothetical protein
VPPFTIQNIGSRLFINKKIPVCRQTILRIGNGGLSLRKVKSMIEVVRWWNKSSNKKKLYRKGSLKLNEDLAVAYAAKKMGLNIPDKPSNASFFVEKDYRKFEPGEVYGFHGLGKINPEFELEILDLAEKQLEITNDWIDKS